MFCRSMFCHRPFETLFVETPSPPHPRKQFFSQRGPYDTKQSSVVRKKIPKKKDNASGFSSFLRHGKRHFFIQRN